MQEICLEDLEDLVEVEQRPMTKDKHLTLKVPSLKISFWPSRSTPVNTTSLDLGHMVFLKNFSKITEKQSKLMMVLLTKNQYALRMKFATTNSVLLRKPPIGEE